MINFDQYDRQNPSVWGQFVHFAYETRNKGFRKYSAKGIFELIRWHTGAGASGETYKVNNNYTADYARKMESQFPEFKGFFRTRELKAKRVTIKV